MRVILQTTVSVTLSVVAFLVMPMFFPFVLIGVFCVLFGPAAVAASLQRPPAAGRPSEAAREDTAVERSRASLSSPSAPPQPAEV